MQRAAGASEFRGFVEPLQSPFSKTSPGSDGSLPLRSRVMRAVILSQLLAALALVTNPASAFLLPTAHRCWDNVHRAKPVSLLLQSPFSPALSPVVGAGAALSRAALTLGEQSRSLARARGVLGLVADGRGGELEMRSTAAAGIGSTTNQVVAKLEREVVFSGFGQRSDVLEAMPGEGFESDEFEAGGARWQVVVYPAGQSKAVAGQVGMGALGFMGPTHRRKGRVGVYLRLNARVQDESVDAAFSLAVVGQQRTGPRFDVAFDCGMRFCHPSRADSSRGRTDDWGAHLLPRESLADFCAPDEGAGAGDLIVRVNLTVFASSRAYLAEDEEGSEGAGGGEDLPSRIGSKVLSLATLPLSDETRRLNGVFWSWPSDIREKLQAGQVFVPTIAPGTPDFRERRAEMFSAGVYPGVEYRVMGVRDALGAPLFSTEGVGDTAVLSVRPIYPVTKVLERRDWPVQVPLAVVPTALSQAMYNTATLCGTVLVCALFLAGGLAGREVVSVYKIPSRSMEPTIEAGDVVIAEKLSARAGRAPRRGEVVLFSPPERLRAVVERAGGRLGPRDLFVKRVAAVPGDRVSVQGNTAVPSNPLPRASGAWLSLASLCAPVGC